MSDEVQPGADGADDQAAFDGAFASAFAGVLTGESAPAVAASADGQATQAEVDAPAQDGKGQEQTAQPQGKTQDAPQEQQEQQEQADQGTEQEPEKPPASAVLAGMTEAEVERLLAKAARVDALEQQIAKTNGKFGEFNRTLQALSQRLATAAPAGAPAAPGAAAPAEVAPDVAAFERDYPDVAAFERDYPDVAAFVRAQMAGLQAQQAPVNPPAAALDVPQHEVPADASQLPQTPALPTGPDDPAVQLALMDHFHEGWRQKVTSDEFALWLNTQSDDVVQEFRSTNSAKRLASILGQFDGWAQARRARQSQGRKRLEQNLTPGAAPSRAPEAPTEDDAFAAAFHSVISKR